MNLFSRSYHLWRHFGASWVLFRLKLIVGQKLHLHERQLPISKWDDRHFLFDLSDPTLGSPESYFRYRLEKVPLFFFDSNDREELAPKLGRFDSLGGSVVPAAKEIRNGRFHFFEEQTRESGFPPNWHWNYITEEEAPRKQHWSRIGDFGCGDIKLIWELSRFSFVYRLVRAWWRTGDANHAETFWRLVESWRENNPPNLGVNWKCGQEASFRVMAWCFGLYGFLRAPESTPERVRNLAQMIAVSGERIASHIDYALSQKNNHGISEAVGLWTIGLLFPEFRRSTEWRKQGHALLEKLALELIYEDGGFSQHTANYQRLMLHDYLWAMRLGEINGAPFSAECKARIGKAGEFLYQLQDAKTGQLPRYGQNDGALILPLNNCESHDFRPVVQSIYYLIKGATVYEPGPWNEDLLWLFGPEALQVSPRPPARVDLAATESGVWTFRSENGFAFVRSPRFKHRPAQADLLNVDLWWNGINVAIDPGTYSYNAPAPWNNSLAQTRFHNTVTVDDLDQMDQTGRFLWLPWANGSGDYYEIEPTGLPTNSFSLWEGEHDGYRRLKAPVNHRRAILKCPNDSWLVVDQLTSQASHTYRLHWLFPMAKHEWDGSRHLRLSLGENGASYHVEVGCTRDTITSLVSAEPDSARGWYAPQYQERKPALSLEMTTNTEAAVFWTFFSPNGAKIERIEETLTITALGWKATVGLNDTLKSGRLVGKIAATLVK